LTPAGLAELAALRDRYKLTPRHTASQLSALAAAKIFVEALKRAGQDLTREKLITALEGLYEYETGLTPRLTFGPNRRVGAAGAYLLTINPDTKDFVPAPGWVNANRPAGGVVRHRARGSPRRGRPRAPQDIRGATFYNSGGGAAARGHSRRLRQIHPSAEELR
jgi:hypothetical protein